MALSIKYIANSLSKKIILNNKLVFDIKGSPGIGLNLPVILICMYIQEVIIVDNFTRSSAYFRINQASH